MMKMISVVLDTTLCFNFILSPPTRPYFSSPTSTQSVPRSEAVDPSISGWSFRPLPALAGYETDSTVHSRASIEADSCLYLRRRTLLGHSLIEPSLRLFLRLLRLSWNLEVIYIYFVHAS